MRTFLFFLGALRECQEAGEVEEMEVEEVEEEEKISWSSRGKRKLTSSLLYIVFKNSFLAFLQWDNNK